MNKKLIVLDYDGVLIDTKDEKLFSGFNTYFELNPSSKLFNNKKLSFENFDEYKDCFQETISHFYKMVDYIGIAGENACAFELIENGVVINNYKEYLKFINKINQDKYNLYNKKMLQLRNHYSKNYEEKYTNLSKPFKSVLKVIKNINQQMVVIICSLKPLENIIFLNKQFGIEKLFEKVLSVNNYGDKIVQIKKYAEVKSILQEDVFFFDDNLKNFKGANSSQINCYLADWGYHTEENINFDESEKISKISINDFNQILNDIIFI